MSDYVAEAVIDQTDSQVAQSGYEGLDGLAQAIVEAYTGLLDLFEEHLHIPASADTQILQNRLSDRLWEMIREPGEVKRFVGRIGPLDRIAEKVGLDPLRIQHFDKPQAILKALSISDVDPPEGIYRVINELDNIYRKIRDSRKLQKDYDELLGQGIGLCKRIERILHQLVLFYGSEELRSIIIKSPISKDLTNDIERVFRGESTLGLTYGVLKRLDTHLQSSGSVDLFEPVFQRPSIFSSLRHHVSGEGNPLIAIPAGFELPAELITALTTLEGVKNLRNSLPHYLANPQSKLDTVEGLHSHLMDLWSHIHRFIDLGEECQLFPLTFILDKKEEGAGSGLRLIGIDEYGGVIVIPRKERTHYDQYVMYKEYFCWSSSGRPGTRTVVVAKT